MPTVACPQCSKTTRVPDGFQDSHELCDHCGYSINLGVSTSDGAGPKQVPPTSSPAGKIEPPLPQSVARTGAGGGADPSGAPPHLAPSRLAPAPLWVQVWAWVGSSLTIGAILAIGIWIWSPWYSAADQAKFADLRKHFEQLKQESIEKFLTDNPSFRENEAFKNAPIERLTLDRASAWVALLSMAWLAVTVVIFAYNFDKANAPRRAWEQEQRRLAAIKAAQPRRGKIICPYCSVVIAEDVLYAGQSIDCPSCHGTLRAPGGHARVAQGADLIYVETRTAIASIDLFSRLYRLFSR